jgi:uncharacterized phage protein (TIGR01671 family)
MIEEQNNNSVQDQNGNKSKPMLANRLLKFRAWDNGKKQWLLGYEYPNLGGFSLEGECILMGEWASICTSFMFENNGKKRTDLKVTQFTGLRDINNKEIYEGDIVEWGHLKGSEENPTRIAIVKIEPDIKFEIINYKTDFYGQNRTFHYGSFAYKNTNKCLEIIGNIFENVNLLPNFL